MSMAEIDVLMGEYVDLMEIKDRQIIMPNEIESRASKFLTAGAHCINWRSHYAELLHGAEARSDVAYKIALFQATGRNITEMKVIADTDPIYQEEQKKVKGYKDKMQYFQMYYELFNNAHIFYRQKMSQTHKESF